jgi:centromere protein I
MLVDLYTALLQHQMALISSGPADSREIRQEVLSDMVEHVATLFSSALLSLPPGSSADLTSSILTFYELLSTSSRPHVIPIHLPPMHLIYMLAQDASVTTLSRICGIIGSYKLAFDAHPKPVKTYYASEVTDAFNYCLRDMYNLVWVSRGLVVQDQKSKGLYCDPILRSTLNEYVRTVDRGYSIATAFTLSYNAWLASLSAAAWRAVEKQKTEKAGSQNITRYHDGPVTEKSLDILKNKGGVIVDWEGADGYKVMVLQWLTERGLGGIRDLMFATVINLKGTA